MSPYEKNAAGVWAGYRLRQRCRWVALSSAVTVPSPAHSSTRSPTTAAPPSYRDSSWLQRVAPFPLADGSSASSRRPSGVQTYSSPPDRTGAFGAVSVSGTALPLRRQDTRPVSASKRPARSPDSEQ